LQLEVEKEKNSANQFAKLVGRKTVDRISSLHIDAGGLIRLGDSAPHCLAEFKRIILAIERFGGRLMIPTFSYSYTDNGIFNWLSTPSKVGIVTDYLRSQNPRRRTVDGMFSYLVYGLESTDEVFSFGSGVYDSFGNESLIARVYAEDGYICCVGDVFHNTPTEVHFLERLLKVNYRLNKTFSGQFIGEGFSGIQKIVFFCRDLNLNLVSDMTRLERRLREENILEIWQVNDLDFYFEAVKIRDVYQLLLQELAKDPLFLCSTPEQREINWQARSKEFRRM
jgi:aminoglycoside 3-N-acetyltransferase